MSLKVLLITLACLVPKKRKEKEAALGGATIMQDDEDFSLLDLLQKNPLALVKDKVVYFSRKIAKLL